MRNIILLDMAGVRVLPVLGLGPEPCYAPDVGVLVDGSLSIDEVDDICGDYLPQIIDRASILELD